MVGTWILYGANGFSGELIAEEAKRRGMRPILAGRREEAVRAVAERLGLEHRIFPLESPEQIARELEGMRAILLAAGPFSATSAPVVEACLRTGTHYLDITGEIAVFEDCHARSAEAKQKGCVLLPGVGFDVVPSDCLAASLKEALPDARTLELGISSEGTWSKGTAKTMFREVPLGGAVRENGRIRRVPLAWRTADVPFRDVTRHAVTISWGDVSTAYYSTGIPNVQVYMALPRHVIRGMRLARPVAPILRFKAFQRVAAGHIERAIKGPSEEVRRTARCQLWGRVTNAAGRSVEGTLETPEGYTLTASAAVRCMAKILDGKVAPGTHTPATAFGSKLIHDFPGCDLRISPS
ncbi:MAG: saccharopine dehydrogenase NADP-binding domain-containing protein [Deltaproteobacteria bacterium]|nr:saccharopine dehydrogenase NADP-binding domain-containing protein [Deltaproteobacteria bacterium]